MDAVLGEHQRYDRAQCLGGEPVALRVSSEREPDLGLTRIVSVDADRDVADQQPGGLDGDLEPGAGLPEPHFAHLGDERLGAVHGVGVSHDW